MANKSYKKFKKEETQAKENKSLSKTLANPTEKWWGKAIVIILIFGFAGSIIVALIVQLIEMLG